MFIILTSCSFHLRSLSSDASATLVFCQGIWIHKAFPTTGPLHLLFYLPGKLFFGNAHASLVAHTIKNLPAMQETQVLSLGWEDPLQKGIATHFSILPEEFHGQRSLAGYSPWGRKESDMTEWLILSYPPTMLDSFSYPQVSAEMSPPLKDLPLIIPPKEGFSLDTVNIDLCSFKALITMLIIWLNYLLVPYYQYWMHMANLKWCKVFTKILT